MELLSCSLLDMVFEILELEGQNLLTKIRSITDKGLKCWKFTIRIIFFIHFGIMVSLADSNVLAFITKSVLLFDNSFPLTKLLMKKITNLYVPLGVRKLTHFYLPQTKFGAR